MAELNETHDDQEDDAEYNFLCDMDVAAEESDREEIRDDRGTHVTRKELNILMEELIQGRE